MPSAGDELRRLLGEFNRRHDAAFSMLASRTGVPLAFAGQAAMSPETFASLAATMLGAGEVMCKGAGRPPPGRIVVESEAGLLVAVALGSRAMIVAVGGKEGSLLSGLQELSGSVRAILASKA